MSSSRNPITSNYLGVRRKGDKGDSAYEIAVRNGFSGTESQWLLTLKGDPGLGSQGNTGKSNYDIAVANGFVGTEEQWLASIKGKNGYTPIKGIDYVDGKEVEFQTTATHIQWRYVGNPDWQNLIILSALKGDPGGKGLKGDPGDDGFTPIKGIDYFDGINGSDGQNIELQKNTTHIQWRYTDDLEWNNLILISDLKGDPGDKGDKGDDSIVPGPKGDDGYTPIKGVDYNDGIDGIGISSIILQSTVGLNKTYRITLTNSSTYDFTVTDGEDGVNGSDASVTKVNVEAVLTGDITSHSHSDAIVYSIIL